MEEKTFITSNTPSSVGVVLHRARNQRKISRRSLAERSGVSFNSIHELEMGHANPTLDTLIRISTVLGLKLAFAFSEEVDNELKLTRSPSSRKRSEAAKRRVPKVSITNDADLGQVDA